MTGPLRIEVRPSRQIAWGIGLLHLGALVACVAGLSSWASWLVATGVVLSGFGNIAGTLLERADSIVALEIRPDGRAVWFTRSGGAATGSINEGCLVSPWIVMVGLSPDSGVLGRGRHLLLANDSADSTALRRLRIHLRWRPAVPVRHDHTAK